MSTEKRGLVEELHKPARRKFPRRKVRILGLFDLWQADLVEMIPYASVNKGYKYLLTVIDTCSKMAWAEPLKRKTAEEVTAAMERVLKTAKKSPKHLQVDMGSEFYNSKCKALMRKHGINLYSSYSTTKASIIERFNRTLKTKMWKEFSVQGSFRWVDLLPKLMRDYNGSVHRTIGMAPIDVTEDDEPMILERLRGSPPKKAQLRQSLKRRLRVGDHVRISKYKAIFEKGYTPNWTTEVFVIVNVHPTVPITYTLKDSHGEIIKGRFYREELQPAKYKDTFLVEKVLRRKKDQSYIKWLGLDSSHNSWIDNSDFV